jgi:hypothetical protein
MIKAPIRELPLREGNVSADGNCFYYSAMARHELNAQDVASPGTLALQKQAWLRGGAIDVVTAATIGGIDGELVRTFESLPGDAARAAEMLDPWRTTGHWLMPGNEHLSSAVAFGAAVHLQRSILVIERTDKGFLDPARLYGARDEEGNLLLTSSPEFGNVIQFYHCISIADALAALQVSPHRWSVCGFERNHFFYFDVEDFMGLSPAQAMAEDVTLCKVTSSDTPSPSSLLAASPSSISPPHTPHLPPSSPSPPRRSSRELS